MGSSPFRTTGSCDDRRPSRRERWRHRQPRPDHKREQKKEHHKVSYALQNVIRPAFERASEFQMLRHDITERSRSQIGRSGEQVVPEMPVQQTGGRIQCASEQQQPSRLKVE